MRARMMAGLGAVAFLAACQMPPEGTDKEDVTRFDTALASIGCDLVDTGDYQAIELQTGLAQPLAQEMASFRLETGDAVRLSNGGVRLVSGACAPEPEEATEDVAEAVAG